MTDEEAAVIEAAYGVDGVFYPPDSDRPSSQFLAKLDTMHQAILRLTEKRKAEEVVAVEAEASR